MARGEWARAVLLAGAALGLDTAMMALARVVDLADGRVASLPTVVAAVVAIPLVRQARARVGPLMTVAGLWFALGLVRHVLGDLEPRWGGEELHGLAHYAWDAVYHAPPLALAAAALTRPPVTEASS